MHKMQIPCSILKVRFKVKGPAGPEFFPASFKYWDSACLLQVLQDVLPHQGLQEEGDGGEHLHALGAGQGSGDSAQTRAFRGISRDGWDTHTDTNTHTHMHTHAHTHRTSRHLGCSRNTSRWVRNNSHTTFIYTTILGYNLVHAHAHTIAHTIGDAAQNGLFEE